MSVLFWITSFRGELTEQAKTGTVCTLDKTHLCMDFSFLHAKCFVRRARIWKEENHVFLRQREQKTRELSVYRNVSWWFDSQMAGASYYHWCSSLHLGSAACQRSCSCFHMWAMFLLVQFFCLLDTLFFQPELDIVFPAYVQGWNDWLWQKGYLSPSSKKSDGLSDSCHLALVMPHSPQRILFLIALKKMSMMFSLFWR